MWGDVRESRGQGASVKAYREVLPEMPHLPQDKQKHCLLDSVAKIQSVLPVSRHQVEPDPGKVVEINRRILSYG